MKIFNYKKYNSGDGFSFVVYDKDNFYHVHYTFNNNFNDGSVSYIGTNNIALQKVFRFNTESECSPEYIFENYTKHIVFTNKCGYEDYEWLEEIFTGLRREFKIDEFLNKV